MNAKEFEIAGRAVVAATEDAPLLAEVLAQVMPGKLGSTAAGHLINECGTGEILRRSAADTASASGVAPSDFLQKIPRSDLRMRVRRGIEEVFQSKHDVIKRSPSTPLFPGLPRFEEPLASGSIRGTQIVIDMQPLFLDRLLNAPSVVKNVGKVLDLAKQKDLDILLVEFGRKGEPQDSPTISQIADRLKDYPRAQTIQKYAMDGGPEIDAALTQHRMFPCVLQFSGIYSDLCLMSSAKGTHLYRPLSHIEVLEAAGSNTIKWNPLMITPNARITRIPIEKYT